MVKSETSLRPKVTDFGHSVAISVQCNVDADADADAPDDANRQFARGTCRRNAPSDAAGWFHTGATDFCGEGVKRKEES